MKSNFLLRVLVFCTFVLFGLETNVNAQAGSDQYFPKDTIISTYVYPGAIIGYANYTTYMNKQAGTSPTVTLVNGGSIVFEVAL